MLTTVEKIKRLELYLSLDNSIVDPVLDMTINKLLSREFDRIVTLKMGLVNQLKEFEQKHNLNSKSFYASYENGEIGDDIDFIEWASTVEMVANVDKRLVLLKIEPSP